MKLLPSGYNLDFLTSAYPELEFELYRSDDSNGFISCFVAYFFQANDCEQAWINITNLIALNYQEPMDNEASAWNIYLALITTNSLGKHLKYQIENDRFALRKLVLDGPEYVGVSGQMIVGPLESAILGSDLELSPVPTPQQHTPDGSEESYVAKLVAKDELLPSDGRDTSITLRRLLISELVLLGNNNNEN